MSFLSALAILSSLKLIMGMVGRGGCFRRVSEGMSVNVSHTESVGERESMKHEGEYEGEHMGEVSALRLA